MLMKVCTHCQGDGFWRRLVKDVHPQQNIANAIAIYADGSRASAMYQCGLPVSYEFPCFKCSSTGEIQWTRGKSIHP
jgi:hypothetical protein